MDRKQNGMPELGRVSKDTYELDGLVKSVKTDNERKSVPNVDFIQRNIKALKPQKSVLPSTHLLSYERLLLPRKTMNTRQSAQLFSRLVTYKVQNQAKASEKKRMEIAREIQQCTFAPVISEGKRERRKGEKEGRKGKEGKEEAGEKEWFRPKLDRHSVKLVEGRESGVFEKLYRESRTRKVNLQDKIRSKSDEERRKINPIKTTRPRIPPTSKPKSVLSQPSISTQSVVNNASIRLLKHRFEADFLAVWGLYSTNDTLTASLVLRQLLKDLHFDSLSDHKSLTSVIWNSLEGSQRGGIRKKDVFLMLKVVMKLPVLVNNAADRGKSEDLYGRFLGEKYAIGPKDVHRLQIAFQSVYLNRKNVLYTHSKSSNRQVLTTHSDQNSSFGSVRSVSPGDLSMSMRKSVDMWGGGCTDRVGTPMSQVSVGSRRL